MYNVAISDLNQRIIKMPVEAPKAPVEEPVPVQDIFCSGVSKVENIGNGNLRVWCYVNQAAAGQGHAESLIVAKIVIPAAAMSAAILQAQAALGRERPPNFIRAADHH